MTTKWTEAKQGTTEHMANQLSEFFQAYVLVGFTMDGERVRLRHDCQSIQTDALQQMLEDVVDLDFKLVPKVRVEEES